MKKYILGLFVLVSVFGLTNYKTVHAETNSNTFTRSLHIGLKGEDVKALQQFLIDKKLLTGKADGSFGRMTAAAVKIFQLQNKLTADGWAGQKTFGFINNPDRSPTTLCTATDPTSITVTSPNGGETFNIGNTMTINWSTCNPPANSWVLLGINGGGHLIEQQIPLSQTSYVWTIPSSFFGYNDYPLTLSPGSSYKISADLFTGVNGGCTGMVNTNAPCIVNPPVLVTSDQSDNNFTILP